MKYLFVSSMLLGALSAAFAAPQVVTSPICTSTCSDDTVCSDGDVCRLFILCLGTPVLHCLPEITTVTTTEVTTPTST
ncbi:hypothetical protein BDP27DRAFT_1311972 [Rhodocollybia butyracea]|uniref:Uncharacterized protein n=1 Tax=Rhodocollybia butyracea TaxID=206335 RepID=A0A9P5UFE3_9AGAR|nr:hypothetical protein BDP27DRAFT_1311972 [Rhodocollybia butyracea]